MSLSVEAKREYMRAYMRRYRRWVRGGGVGNVLKRDRQMLRLRHVMKIALNRLARARRLAQENPGSVDERHLSLGWQFNQIEREER